MRSAGGHSAAMEGMPKPRLGRESSPCENARVRRLASIRACKTGSGQSRDSIPDAQADAVFSG